MNSSNSIGLHPTVMEPEAISPDRRDQVEALLTAYEQEVINRTNKLFVWLLVIQWGFSILFAGFFSPRIWAGEQSSIHPHLLAAIFLGGLLVIPPILSTRWFPYRPLTRHAIAVAQVCFSSLLIHLTGGRIETHFHVFGSLAFLALYRDWRVLPTATVVVALDHFSRGVWFPQSVYGVPYATAWRTLEHAGWVVFEDIVLIWGCLVSQREMRIICERQDENKQLLEKLEERVRERTRALEAEIVERELTTVKLLQSEDRYRKLFENVPIGIFETTKSGAIRLANPHLLGILGLPADVELSQLSMAGGAIFPTAERTRFWQRLETERELRSYETTIKRGDNTDANIVINARLRPSENGEEPGCEGTIEDISVRKRAERELKTLNNQLISASRQAGMAEVATGVLHNVGNVLTSVNLTVHNIQDQLRTSRAGLLRNVAGVLKMERAKLADYLLSDSNGSKLPDFIDNLAQRLGSENASLQADANALAQHCEHIREIVVTQQSSARLLGMVESVVPARLVEDAVKLIQESFTRHRVVLETEYADVGEVRVDRHKTLQILVNLLHNAKDAVEKCEKEKRRIKIQIANKDSGFASITVRDFGDGVPQENLTRLFQHGFTTKKDGHGFGLHSSALAAREMKGNLRVESEGLGKGASFILSLPLITPS